MDLAWVESYRVATSRADLRLAPGEQILGGGTWLFSEPQPAITGLVDLSGLRWTPVEALPSGGLRIAGTCTIEQLQAHPWPAPVAGLVRDCADALLMSFKVQHTATVGGNLCLGLPAGAMITLTSALEGTLVIWTPDGGERRQQVVDFVLDAKVTTLAPGEVLRAIDIPAGALGRRYALRRLALTDRGRSAAVVVAALGEQLVVTVTAATTRPVVLTLAPDADEAAIRNAVAGITGWYDDQHGPADWRAAITATLAVGAAEAVAEVAP